MKRKIYGRGKVALKFAILLVLCQPIISLAGDFTFSSSGTIGPNDVYDNVYVENNGTIVDMTGGQVSSLSMYDSSIFNLYDGQISGFFGGISISSLSTINVLGGTIDKNVDFVVDGNANFTGGNITDYRLKTYKDSIVTFTGGSLNFDYFDIQGGMDIRGGDLTVDDVGLHIESVINIFSENYNYNADSKVLTAYLIDAGYLSMSGLDQLEYDSINFVPEPTTLLLLSLGGLFLRTRR